MDKSGLAKRMAIELLREHEGDVNKALRSLSSEGQVAAPADKKKAPGAMDKLASTMSELSISTKAKKDSSGDKDNQSYSYEQARDEILRNEVCTAPPRKHPHKKPSWWHLPYYIETGEPVLTFHDVLRSPRPRRQRSNSSSKKPRKPTTQKPAPDKPKPITPSGPPASLPLAPPPPPRRGGRRRSGCPG